MGFFRLAKHGFSGGRRLPRAIEPVAPAAGRRAAPAPKRQGDAVEYRNAALMLRQQGAAVMGTEDDAEHPGPASKRRGCHGRHMGQQRMGGPGTGTGARAGMAAGSRGGHRAGRLNGAGALQRATMRRGHSHAFSCRLSTDGCFVPRRRQSLASAATIGKACAQPEAALMIGDWLSVSYFHLYLLGLRCRLILR